jgi:hypothetical protein
MRSVYNLIIWPLKAGIEFEKSFGIGLRLCVMDDYVTGEFHAGWPRFYVEYRR